MAKSSIGIRATPNQIFYCVLTGEFDEFEITQIDKIVTPKALEIPEQLKFIRNTLCDIINENNVLSACIRIAESNARKTNIPRIYLEGVIQELIASSTIEKYYVGQISSISARLGIDRSDFKPFASGETIYQEIEIWNELNLEQRESLLAAISSLNF